MSQPPYPPQQYGPYPPPPQRSAKKRRWPIVLSAIVGVVLLGGVVVVVALDRLDSAPEGDVDFAALPAAKFPKVQVPKLDALGFDPASTRMCGAVAKTMTARYYIAERAENDQGYGDAQSTVCHYTTSVMALQKEGSKSIEAEVGGWRTESESDAERSFQRELDIADRHGRSFKKTKLERLPLGDAGFLQTYEYENRGTAVAIIRSGQDFIRVKAAGRLMRIGKTNSLGLGGGVAHLEDPVPAAVAHTEIAGILRALGGGGGAEPQNTKPDLKASPLLAQVKTPRLAVDGLKADRAGADQVCRTFSAGATRAGMRLDESGPNDTNTAGGKIGKWECTYRASGLVMTVIVSSYPKDGSAGSAAAEHGDGLTQATNFARSNGQKGEKVSPLYALPAGQSGYAIYHVASSFGQAKAGFLIGEGTLVEISMSGSRRPEGKILSNPLPESTVLKALGTTLS